MEILYIIYYAGGIAFQPENSANFWETHFACSSQW